MNWAYKLEIRKYGKTVGNMTPYNVVYKDVFINESDAVKLRDVLARSLKKNYRAEITLVSI